VTALGGYAATAITAITVQNTLGVSAVHPIPPELVTAQARAVLDDIGADVIKIGMLGDAAMIRAIAELLASFPHIATVIDPVMVAKGGAPLMQPEAIALLRDELIPRATLLTPNAPEAEALTGLTVKDEGDLEPAGEALWTLGADSVLMKGGHLSGERVTDLLMTPEGRWTFWNPRIETRHTHGTGCTLASAIAVGLAQGLALEPAVERAREYTLEAIRRAPGFGAGHGPLDHAWPLRGGPA
jgi:hydroxymethylpyrimidine/phosphomethylpyrimidine kinase